MKGWGKLEIKRKDMREGSPTRLEVKCLWENDDKISEIEKNRIELQAKEKEG